ncbi:caspase family protein [Brasilonema sp. CT11]|nr:caspase family protein [Brasilonema sp. CT11]
MDGYALVIGIANYKNFTQQLPKAVTDAQSIAQVLREHGRFKVQPLPGKLVESENCWRVAPDKKLTGKELGSVLRMFLLEKAKDHKALIYFAGHGFEAPTLTGKQKGYLATSDCTGDGQNAIAFDDFNDLIRKSELTSLVVLLDCCYAGSFLEKSFLRSSFPVFNSKTDYCLITASREFERAREDVEGGIFTQAVLKGLSHDRADEKTGEVNANDLFSFVSRELKHSGQEPIYMGGGRSISLVWYPPKNPVVTAVVREECPYRGLEAFDKQHAQFFFGRNKVVEDILQKLAQAQFVPIIGASGSGKSSVVRAGLIPQLEKNGWRVLEPIKPGIEPLAKLRAAFEPFFQRPREIQQLYDFIHNSPDGLHRVIERLPGSESFLLIVDQFEEVFTLCPKEEERRKFLELLTNCSVCKRLAIVTTMRADFLEPCLSYPSLTQLIQNQAVYMPPLVGGELEQAIASPAALQGYHFEDGLLGEIMQDVGKEQGCLPLLEFALTELWEKRDNQKHQLTVEQYRVMGGVIGALDRHAEAIYQSFTLHEQEWVKRIFLKLVRTGEAEKDTRQRQPRAKLLAIGDDNVISDVLDELIEGRLLVTGQEEQQGEAWVDLAHEALMEAWQRFDEWCEENRELRRLIDRVEDHLRQWQRERKNENLMMGGLLVKVREKWQELEPDFDSAAKEFYQQSDAYQQDKTALLNNFFNEIDNYRKQVQEVERLVNKKIQAAEAHSSEANNNGSFYAEFQKIKDCEKSIETIRETVQSNFNIPNNFKIQSNFKVMAELHQKVADGLKTIERFEQRMQASKIAAEWLDRNRETLVKASADYALATDSSLTFPGGSADSQEKIKRFHGNIDDYIDWLCYSLNLGMPIPLGEVEITPLLPDSAYAAAFNFINREMVSNKLSDNIAEELEAYINYLITYFSSTSSLQ